MAEARRSTVIPGSQEGIRQAVNDFEAFSLENQLPADWTWPLFVVLDELLSNVVRHGYRQGNQEGRIEIQFSLEDGDLELTIIDDADPFNPLAAPDPVTSGPAEGRPVGGLGILFVRKLMDHVDYERREGRNHLTCRRRIDA
jgi:serine/threonine-protein kinase RsbW